MASDNCGSSILAQIETVKCEFNKENTKTLFNEESCKNRSRESYPLAIYQSIDGFLDNLQSLSQSNTTNNVQQPHRLQYQQHLQPLSQSNITNNVQPQHRPQYQQQYSSYHIQQQQYSSYHMQHQQQRQHPTYHQSSNRNVSNKENLLPIPDLILLIYLNVL